MPYKRNIDIERVEADYRAGLLSITEIAALHGCTHTYVGKLAKRNGWTRDLSNKVRIVTKAKLSADPPMSAESEELAVNQAADVRVAVVLSHRKHIGRLQRIVGNLYEAIERQSEAVKEIDPKDDKDRIIAALMTPHQITQTAQKLADTQAKLITMERQAFSIADEAAPAEKPYEERLKEMVGGGEE